MAHQVHGQLNPVGGGDPIPLVRENLILGRLESCDICLKLPNVSKRHCRLQFDKGFWWIEDMESRNGVKVNDMRISQKKVLHPDDTVTIAKRTWSIEYEPPVGQSTLEELVEDDPMSQPLLEKAGLLRRKRQPNNRPRRWDDQLDELDDE